MQSGFVVVGVDMLWTCSGVALVGDAAHSMWAALGQGCNAALETCLVLAETLDKNRQQPLSYALEQYTSTRKPDTDAIGRLSEKGMGGTKKRAASNSFLINMVRPGTQ
eukprot:scaffold451_cov365-Prasinococcus_capsulatus_cf.AAC.26